MSISDARKSIEIGFEEVNLIATGDMGIGNTILSTAKETFTHGKALKSKIRVLSTYCSSSYCYDILSLFLFPKHSWKDP
jgi:hypothetical protein